MSGALRQLHIAGSRSSLAVAAATPGRTPAFVASATASVSTAVRHVPPASRFGGCNARDAATAKQNGAALIPDGMEQNRMKSSSSCSNSSSTSPAGRGGGGGGHAPLSGAKRTVSSNSSSLLAPSAWSGGASVGGGPAQLATRVDAVVIGAGQAGLSVGYHLQRAGGLRFVTLDANQEAGGAWRHRWPSLELFSTRKWSSLPGYPMFANGACEDGYPSTREMALYMEEYEQMMKLNVVRPVTVTGVTRTAMGTFLVDTDCLLGGTPARWEARTVISATGTHTAPVWPRLPGMETFRGTQIHSSQYRSAEDFRGARVAVVGAGNSGAQILAEVSQIGMASSTLWSTLDEPSFLPEGLSGKEIFDTVARLRQRQGFVRKEDIPSLHSVIMQPGVVEAHERGVYDQRVPAFTRLTPNGVAWDASSDGRVPEGEAEVDVIIWCTGYGASTSHLSRLGVVRPDSTVAMDGRDMGETDMPGVFAVGYGNWAGVGSGSIPGSTFYAKRAAASAVQHLRGGNSYDSSNVTVEAAMAGQRQTLTFGGSARASRTWPTVGRASALAGGNRAAVSGRVQVSRYAETRGTSSADEEQVAVAA